MDGTDTSSAASAGSVSDVAPTDPGVQDSLFALVQRLDAASLFTAYDALRDAAYRLGMTTEQFDRSGNRIAVRTRTILVRPGQSVVRTADSSGTFDYGYLQRFSPMDVSDGQPWRLAEEMVPDDPPYALPRTREGYIYSAGKDTLAGFGAVDVVDIRAHPELGNDQAIRSARLYVEPGTTRIVGHALERDDAAIWFREQSRLFLSIRKDAAGDWLPARVEVETKIRMPFRPTQRFRTQTTFSDVEMPASASKSAEQAGKRIVFGNTR